MRGWTWLLCGAAFLPPAVGAQSREIVSLAPREGVTLSYFVGDMGGRKPEAVALLFSGGGGNIRLRMENGEPRFAPGNFLIRARGEFIRNGIQPILVDNPSDQQAGQGMTDGFREGAAHLADVRAVLADVRRRLPGLPVFLVGTSRSTISIAHLGRAMTPGSDVDGIVLTSSLFLQGRRPVLASFDFPAIRLPLLFVHHREDACTSTPYHEAARLSPPFPLVSVRGGKPPESGPCDPFAAHGYFGREAETVAAIAAWMLKKPYPKDID